MTEHFTRAEAATLAKAAGFEVRRGLGLRESVPEDVFARGLISEEVTVLCNAAVTAKLKEWEAQGAVAYLAWKDGKPCYEGGDGVCEDAVWPLDDTDDRTSMPVYTHALPAQLAEQPIKLYADSSNPDMFNRDLLDAAGNRYTIMTPTMCQFDIDASALRAAGLEMKIDGMEPAPDGSSRAKMYWCKVDGQPAEPVNAEYGYWSQVIEMFVERLNHGPQTVEASDVLALLSDCQYLENLSRAQAAPAVGVPVFPERIMRQLTIMADRVGDEFHGPWEDGDGEPLQDDAEAAIAWIASAQPQQKEGV